MKTFSDLVFVALMVKALQELATAGLISEPLFMVVTLFIPLFLGWAYKAESDNTYMTGFNIAAFIREGMALATLVIFLGILDRLIAPAFYSAVMGSWSLYAVGRIFSRSLWLLVGVTVVVVALYIQ